MSSETLEFAGCNFFRLRLAYSILSGRPIRIVNIRKNDDRPGIRDFEAKLIGLLEKVTNGTKVEISRTGTQVVFRPGMITGGVVNLDCGTDRCISYFLEPLILLSPFCKIAMTIKLKGVTNAPGELSVDGMKAAWLKIYNKFVLNDEKLDIKIQARGLKPEGGGVVIFTAPIVKTLRPVKRQQVGKVCKIRGQAYVTKVTPSLAYRMIDAAKKAMHGYISDVYIAVDQRKGDAGGVSPGYGLFLTAETTEGVIYQSEAISRPKGEAGNPILPEDIGIEAGHALLQQIYMGGALDSSAQVLASTFMTLCPKDVSHFLYGPLPMYSVHTLRHLKQFFEIEFKLDDYRKTLSEEEADLRMGSPDKAMITAVGMNRPKSLADRIKVEEDIDIQLCDIDKPDKENMTPYQFKPQFKPRSNSLANPIRKQRSIIEFCEKKRLLTPSQPISKKTTENKRRTAEKIYREDMQVLRKKENTKERKNKSQRKDRVLRELLQQKLSSDFAIPVSAFQKLVKEVLNEKHPGFRIQYNAVEALQRESEMMLTKMMRLGNFLAEHAKRGTLKVEDVTLLKTIFETNRDGCPFYA